MATEQEELIEETDLQRFAIACAVCVADEIRRVVKSRGRCVLALAGGSSPTKIHEALTQPTLVGEIPWESVHVVFGDERAVPSDSKDSNYGNALKSLLNHVGVRPEHIYPMRAWEGPLGAEALRYDEQLVALTGAEKIAQIDVLMLGVGEDAHIFSLYPGCSAIEANEKRSVVAMYRPPMNPPHERISLTARALEEARFVMVLFVGAKKKLAYEKYRENTGSESKYPVRLVHRAKGQRVIGVCLV